MAADFGRFEVQSMESEVSPERARQVLEVLTAGGSMDHINTSLALRLMPLAEELGETALVERLLDHAMQVASTDEERGWARFEGLKHVQANLESFLALAESTETMEGAQALTAAVHHYIALVHLSEGQLDEARATAQRALRLRTVIDDLEGMSYGMALLMTIAKRQHDEDTAIAVGTERLELLKRLKDEEGQMEAIADLAHCQATIGEFGAAQELFTQSLEHAQALESLSGQLVARWGLADIAEIQQDYETAMLMLSEALHEFLAVNIPAPAPLRQRIHDLTELQNTPQDEGAV
jgi:tetratricopeptide (TPR) repeat protein